MCQVSSLAGRLEVSDRLLDELRSQNRSHLQELRDLKMLLKERDDMVRGGAGAPVCMMRE